MAKRRYSMGIDFGTLSARAVVVDIANGREVASCVSDYDHGVIDDVLPAGRVKLGPEWALQDPADYLKALREIVPATIRAAKVKPADIIGIGVDFTGCTLLAVDKDNQPLCAQPRFRKNPHAYAKLWKSHSAQPWADRINDLARKRGEEWIAAYGGRISSEWFFPKMLQTLEEAPGVFKAADRFIEAADWLVLMLTGSERRSSSVAGFKALWSRETGLPPKSFLCKLHPKLANVVGQKMPTTYHPVGTKAGELTAEMAKLTGLKEGTPVAVGILDGHAGIPGCGVAEAGRMALILGSSGCHMVLARRMKSIEGVAAVVRDGAIPGYYCYEAGQSGVGDIFGWFVEKCVPEDYHAEAKGKGVSVHEILEAKGRKLRPGQSGLLCLDWHSGNRSVLMDAGLSGVHLGMTLSTKPEESYRALIEATAFGTRKIIDTFTAAGVRIGELVACGGLTKNKMLMQIYSDVTGRPIQVASSEQTCALGSAIYGAAAAGPEAGGYAGVPEAVAKMVRPPKVSYAPNKEFHKTYSELYREYEAVHDYFGRGTNEVIERLEAIRDREAARAIRKKKA